MYNWGVFESDESHFPFRMKLLLCMRYSNAHRRSGIFMTQKDVYKPSSTRGVSSSTKGQGQVVNHKNVKLLV